MSGTSPVPWAAMEMEVAPATTQVTAWELRQTKWGTGWRRFVFPGILLAYLPTINQTALLRQALDDASVPFGMSETQEIMRRTWHVEARSVRPDHRMVGHTGFLTTARLLVPVADAPAQGQDAVKASADAENEEEEIDQD